MLSRPAAFFDRDGVINVDHGYVHDPANFELLNGVVEALHLCQREGFYLFVVTNQSGVARGYFTEEAVERLHQHMKNVLAAHGVRLTDIVYCPHHPQATLAQYRKLCACRKPRPAMLEGLIEKWMVDRAGSFLIGDKGSDVAAARAANVQGYLYEGGSLPQLVQMAIAQSRNPEVSPEHAPKPLS